MDDQLIRALNGKSQSRGGLNLKDLKEALIQIFPDEEHKIRQFQIRSELEREYSGRFVTGEPKEKAYSIPADKFYEHWTLYNSQSDYKFFGSHDYLERYKYIPIVYDREGILDALNKYDEFVAPYPMEDFFERNPDLLLAIIEKFPHYSPNSDRFFYKTGYELAVDNYDTAMIIANKGIINYDVINEEIIDRNLALALVRGNPGNILRIPKNFQADRELLEEHFEFVGGRQDLDIYSLPDSDMILDINFVKEMYDRDPIYKHTVDVYGYHAKSHNEKATDIGIAYSLIKEDPRNIRYVDEELLDNENFMVEVYRIDPELAERYADQRLKEHSYLYKPQIRANIWRKR